MVERKKAEDHLDEDHTIMAEMGPARIVSQKGTEIRAEAVPVNEAVPEIVPDISVVRVVAVSDQVMREAYDHMESEQQEQQDGPQSAFADERDLHDGDAAKQAIEYEKENVHVLLLSG